MKTYVHNPTEVEAIKVQRPFKNITTAVPFAHMVKSPGSGAFKYFTISTPGENEVKRAFEGDWILRYPTGCYSVLTEEQFERYYGDSPDAD